MKPYILNLTNQLIGSNRYDEEFLDLNDPKKFVQFVTIDLFSGNVRCMTPETLGRIMGSLETYDVMASNQEIIENAGFSGNPAEFLRGIVSFFLACVIRDRIFCGGENNLPRWERKPRVTK